MLGHDVPIVVRWCASFDPRVGRGVLAPQSGGGDGKSGETDVAFTGDGGAVEQFPKTFVHMNVVVGDPRSVEDFGKKIGNETGESVSICTSPRTQCSGVLGDRDWDGGSIDFIGHARNGGHQADFDLGCIGKDCYGDPEQGYWEDAHGRDDRLLKYEGQNWPPLRKAQVTPALQIRKYTYIYIKSCKINPKRYMIHSYTLPHRKSKIKDPKFFLITFKSCVT